ncbi:MAG: ATP-binding protein [Cyanobacteria bacterium P01_D01_bin.1]
MKLQAKVLSGYAASLALVVLVGLWGVFNLWRLGRASGDILQENYRSIRAADSMIDALERQDSATLILLLNDDAEAGQSLFLEYQVQFLQWLSRAKDNVTLSGEAQILRDLEAAYTDYLLSVDQLAVLPEGETDEYEQEVRPAFQLVRDSATELRDLNQTAMATAAERAADTSQQAIASVAIAGLSAATIGFIISWLLSRNLVQPVKAIRGATEQIASGNYDVRLVIASQDELGQLADEINIMSQRLQAFKALNLDKVVAEKQRSEAIINSLSDGIVVVDDQLHIVAINPVAAMVFGTKPELAQGRHCLEIIDDRTLYSQIQSVAESQTPALPEGTAVELKQAELTIERGSIEHYQYLTTPVTTEDNRRLGVVLLLQNVTNLKQLDQLKSEFVMTASHELRTPLTGMAMSIDLLTETAQTKLSENEQELLKTAQEDVERLRDLVNDLLDLSKIESGKLEMERTPTDPKKLVERAIDLLKIQAEDKQIEIISQMAGNLATVEADVNKITWVMTNLIANALRYAKETIEVVTRRHGTWISIAVIDDGPGIDPVYQSKIFDKFVQVKTEKDVGGTGLGLAICKEIVKAHGGTIWVDSTPGHGSTFTFTLPVTSATPA